MILIGSVLSSHSAQQSSENPNKTGRKLGNQNIRSGWMSISMGIMKGGSRIYWFVLTSETLSWFKDEEVFKRKRSFLPNPFPHSNIVHL